MKLQFINPNTSTKQVTVSVHATGNLMLSPEDIQSLGIQDIKHYLVAKSTEKQEDNKFRMFLIESEETPSTIKVYRVKDNTVLKLASVFDQFNLNYQNVAPVLQIEKSNKDYKGQKMLILTAIKEKERSKKKTESEKQTVTTKQV